MDKELHHALTGMQMYKYDNSPYTNFIIVTKEEKEKIKQHKWYRIISNHWDEYTWKCKDCYGKLVTSRNTCFYYNYITGCDDCKMDKACR